MDAFILAFAIFVDSAAEDACSGIADCLNRRCLPGRFLYHIRTCCNYINLQSESLIITIQCKKCFQLYGNDCIPSKKPLLFHITNVMSYCDNEVTCELQYCELTNKNETGRNV